MPKRGERLSEAQRKRIGEGARRGQRRWLRGLQVQPAHVRRFIASKHVHASLRGLLTEALRETGELVALLGGEPTAAQKVLLGLWTMQRVAALASLERWLGGAKPSALLAVSAHGNSCARLLSQLGLSRAEVDVEDAALEEYRRAMRDAEQRGRTDRGPAGVMTGPSSPGGESRSAVSDSAPGALGSAGAQAPSAAPHAPGPNGARR